MRLLDKSISGATLVAGATWLTACAPIGALDPVPSAGTGASLTIATGPEADYPVVLGEPFSIDGITYTPSDTLNYDEVGYATIDDGGAVGITAAHRILPLPSYVEITSLESGRTILARVERRGPMTNDRLIALAPAALAQLAVSEGHPVRVRRVNPPEEERAELRADRSVAERMSTPAGLLAVLRKKLPASGSASLRRAAPPAQRGETAATEPIRAIDPNTEAPRTEFPADDDVTVGTRVAAPEVGTVPAASADGRFVVQAGAYSTRAAAERVAKAIGGYVESVGRLWRVRTGPFTTRGQAEAALAKVRASGYTDAQIYTRN